MIQRDLPYARYAEVYDELGQTLIGAALARATLSWLSNAGIHPSSALDLACGTGAATLELAKAGIETVGVDRSRPMLQRAQEKSFAAGYSMLFAQADMQTRPVSRQFDLVTCFFDAVNYLTSLDELHNFLYSAFHMVRVGGYLVFDVNTHKRMDEGWGDACFIAADRPDLFGVYRSWFDRATGFSPLIITFFCRKENQDWERFDEEHVERSYALGELWQAIAQAGLTVRDCRSFNDRTSAIEGPGNEDSYRVIWIAERTISERAIDREFNST